MESIKRKPRKNRKIRLIPIVDAEVFERVASAVRELNASKNVDKAYELILQREKVRALKEERAKALEEKETAKLNLRRTQVDAEARSRLLEQQTRDQQSMLKSQHEQARTLEQHKIQLQVEAQRRAAQEESKLIRERQAQELRIERQKLQLQESSERRIAQERLRALKRETEIQAVVERAKQLAKGEARLREARANKDITLDVIQKKADAWCAAICRSTKQILSDRQLLRNITVTLALGFLTKALISVAEDTLKDQFSRPHLLFSSYIASPIMAPTPLMTPRLKEVIATHLKSPWGRTVLLSGPPGTGKTTFGKVLANLSGNRLIVCSGGGLMNAGSRGADELRKILRWANRRPDRSLFIDEAEAMLSRRTDSTSEALRATLAEFLATTGESDRRATIILATNRPRSLDPAVLDRVDEEIEFKLPSNTEREAIIRYHITSAKAALQHRESGSIGRSIWKVLWRKTRVLKTDDHEGDACLDQLSMSELITATEGMSGRQIANYCRKFVVHYAPCSKNGRLQAT